MQILNNYNECCGCAACANICPKHCISMKADKEGFVYPNVDDSLCVNCKRCHQACPVLNKHTRKIEILDSYVIQNRNSKIKRESTSGGFFSVIANYVIELNGVIYAPIFNKNMEVEHKEITTIKEVNLARGSKYVQSKIGECYKKVKDKLKKGRIVCFSGTPCQVEGLIKFLGESPENLITIGVVCHGVPSPKVWKKYLLEMEQKYKKKIEFVNFRDKTLGYHRSGIKIYFEDGSSKVMTPPDIYLSTFFAEICSRPSCYQCKFKDLGRISDFTLFDAWNSEDEEVGLDNQGATNVFINSKAGIRIFEKVKTDLVYKKVDYKQAVKDDGIMVLNSAIENPNRSKFFQDIDKYKLTKLRSLYYPLSFKQRLKYIFKDILNRLKLLEIVDRIR